MCAPASPGAHDARKKLSHTDALVVLPRSCLFLQGQHLITGRTPHVAGACLSQELHPPTVYWQSGKPEESGGNLKAKEKRLQLDGLEPRVCSCRAAVVVVRAVLGTVGRFTASLASTHRMPDVPLTS